MNSHPYLFLTVFFFVAVAFADGDLAYAYHPDDVADAVVEPLAWHGQPVVAIPLERFRTFEAVGGLYRHRSPRTVAVSGPVTLAEAAAATASDPVGA